MDATKKAGCKPLISASLFAADFARLGEEACRAENAGVDSLHFDIMDGYYIPDIALSPYDVRALRPLCSLPFDLHFYVKEPLRNIRIFSGLKPDLISVLVDTCRDFDEVFGLIRDEGARVGLTITPGDDLDIIRPLLPKIDLLMVLSVYLEPGKMKYLPTTPDRVKAVRQIMEEEGVSVLIGTDGGIDLSNAASLVKAGTDFLVIGKGLFGAKDMAAVVREIRAMA
jgi:ribulose-phosphate 3-epimerase